MIRISTEKFSLKRRNNLNSRKETIKEKRKELEKHIKEHIKVWIDKNNILKGGEKISVDIKITKPREIVVSDQLEEKDWMNILSSDIWSENQRKVLGMFMEARRTFFVREVAENLDESFTYAMLWSINSYLSKLDLPYRLQTFKSWGVGWLNCKLRMVIIQGQKD